MLTAARPPTAIFAASDTQALGVMAAARDCGLQVPDDLSIIGYDDIEAADYVGLSTIRQGCSSPGRRGAEILLAEIERPSRAGTRRPAVARARGPCDHGACEGGPSLTDGLADRMRSHRDQGVHSPGPGDPSKSNRRRNPGSTMNASRATPPTVRGSHMPFRRMCRRPRVTDRGRRNPGRPRSPCGRHPPVPRRGGTHQEVGRGLQRFAVRRTRSS